MTVVLGRVVGGPKCLPTWLEHCYYVLCIQVVGYSGTQEGWL